MTQSPFAPPPSSEGHPGGRDGVGSDQGRRSFFVRSTGENASFRSSDGQIRLVAGGSDTEGRFAAAVSEWHKGSEPPPHYRDREDECFFILEGEVDFYCGPEVYHAAGGDFVFVPSGTPFASLCKTDVARALVQAIPVDGKPVTADCFLKEMSEVVMSASQATPVPSPQSIHARIVEIAAKYHVRPVAPDDIARLMPRYPVREDDAV